jgi:predicted phosphate transport protein (TIGR00153 family)
MKFRLFPQNTEFFNLFTKSSENTVEGAKLYLEMCERFEDPKASQKAIRDCEHQGDQFTHDIVRLVNTTFVTPVDREDIHLLATGLDDIMDYIEAAADIFILHRIDKPTEVAREQARVLVRICENLGEAMRKLRTFKGLEPHFAEIGEMENEGDRIYRRAVADLFNGDHKSLDVLKFKELYEQVEHAIDSCESVSNTLEAIVLKHA